MKYTGNTIKIHFWFPIAVVLVFVLFFMKLSYVALNNEVEGTNIRELAENRSTATKTLVADRGKIYDNAGEILAQNVNSYTLIAYLSESRTTNEKNPKHVVDKEGTARALAEILEPLNESTNYEYILSRLNVKGAYQVEFGKGGKNLTELVKQKIDSLDLPGIDFVKSSKRYYQNGDFASYIIGYAKKSDESEEINGEMGIEGYCNRYLKGTDGYITYQKDAFGYQMADRFSYTEEALDGYDVYLTLDKQIQIFLDNSVEEFKKVNPEWVTITIADADTGAIVGSSTTPSFNPNELNIANYNNPLTSYTYEPGSTMKIFSFMSAIEEQKYNGSDKYMSGKIQVDDYTISDWNKTGWGSITYDVGFTYSSNVAAVKLAQGIGKKKLRSYYEKLGFGALTNIELSGELKGDIDFEYGTEFASASYGQGITVTPIQMIQALTTITNDGTVLKPYIIDKIVDPNTGKTVYQGKRTEKEKVYSTSTVNKIIELMDLTVNGDDPAATGRYYSTPSVRLIGKTGTANYTNGGANYVTGTYNNIRSFAGVFPKEKPEYIIYVAVKDLNGNSRTIGTIIKKLVESVAKYRNLDERESDKDESKIVKLDNYVSTSVISSVSKLNGIGIEPIIIGDGNMVIKQYPKASTKTSRNAKVILVTNGNNITMPDITGWSSSDVINFAKIVGIPYELNGYGYVTSTNIQSGAIIDVTTTLVVNLESINPSSLTQSVNPKEEE